MKIGSKRKRINRNGGAFMKKYGKLDGFTMIYHNKNISMYLVEKNQQCFT